ncbi:hypothetical protein ACO0K9_15310 [Undibacterium sp. Ji50W]|uniref:hypothetical protein n=1 Tax=Undibacterium sp. Ji50W TaxID=3413041 RepID=UPI003BF37F09
MKAKREAYIASIKTQLDELNVNLAEIETKIASTTAAAHAQYAEEMMKLHKQSQQVQDKLAEVKVASEETWEGMINSTEKVRDAFINSFRFFKEQLKDKP